jgi:hypothetical protein
MDYSPFYYTYSTISQTLAGAFGFLGAVVIYRTQAIESLIGELASVVEGATSEATQTTLKRLRLQGDWAEFVRTVRSEGTPGKVWSGWGTHVECLEELEPRVGQLTAIKKSLGRSLFNTAGTIAACLVCMPLTNGSTFLGRPGPAWLVLSVVVGYAIFTIAMYYPLVKDLVDLSGTARDTSNISR